MTVRLLVFLLALLAPLGGMGQSFRFGDDPVAPIALRTPDVVISAGQSHRGLWWSGMGSMGFSPQGGLLLTPAVSSPVVFPSGVLPPAAFKPTQSMTNRLTSYTPAMLFGYPDPASPNDAGNGLTMGRSGVLAQQMLRQRYGKPLKPTIEFDMMCSASSWVQGPCGGLGPPTATFTGTTVAATGIMTVTGITGTIIVGQTEYPVTFTPTFNFKATVDTFGTSGTTGIGGNGTYHLSGNVTDITAQPMFSVSGVWGEFRNFIKPSIAASLPDQGQHLASPANYRSVRWLQNGSFDHSSEAPTIAEYTAMQAAYDAENLSGAGTTGMLYYMGIQTQPAASVATANNLGTITFVRANANGRTIGTTPIYQWALVGDGVHTVNFGVIRYGELEGYAAYVQEDLGVAFTPLWLSKTTPVSVAGTTIRIPFDRPAGSPFAGFPLQWVANSDEGLIVWPQYGFHVYRSGVEIPLCTDPVISGLIVILDICQAPLSGDEYSYDIYGPNTGSTTMYGIGGNLAMPGPDSVFFPGRQITPFAWPLIGNLP